MLLIVNADLVEYIENIIYISLELPDSKREYYNELSYSGVVSDKKSFRTLKDDTLKYRENFRDGSSSFYGGCPAVWLS